MHRDRDTNRDRRAGDAPTREPRGAAWLVGADVQLSEAEHRDGLRRLFLIALADAAPGVVRELRSLPSDAEVPAWAERHHLGVPWLISAALEARAFWREFSVEPTCERRTVPDRRAVAPRFEVGERRAVAWPVEAPAVGGWRGDEWLSAEDRQRLPLSDARQPMTEAEALRQLAPVPVRMTRPGRSMPYAVRPVAAVTPNEQGWRSAQAIEKDRRLWESARRQSFERHSDPERPVRRALAQPQHLHWLVLTIVRGWSPWDIAGPQPGDGAGPDERRNKASKIRQAVQRTRAAIGL